MPRLTHDSTGRQRIVPNRSVSVYLRDGWSRADAQEDGGSPPPEDSGGGPAASDVKAAWVDYAVTQGIDRSEAESMTKAELVEMLS